MSVLGSAGHQRKWNSFQYKDEKGNILWTDEATQNRRRMGILRERFLKKYPNVRFDLSVPNDWADITMEDKGEMSKGYKVQVSFHTNGLSNTNANGAFMIPNVHPKYAHLDLNKKFLKAWCDATGIANNGMYIVHNDGSEWGKVVDAPNVAYKNYYKEQDLDESGCLLMMECGHHSNASDVEKLMDYDTIVKGCDALVNVLGEYLGLVPSKAPVTLKDFALLELGNKGTKYRVEYYKEDRPEDWCMIFAYLMGKKVGLDIPKVDDVNSFIEWAITKGYYYSDIDKVYKGKPTKDRPKGIDTYTLFDWNRNGYGDHIGILTTEDSRNIYTAEGNIGNNNNNYSTVGSRSYDKSSQDILGYICVPKSTSETIKLLVDVKGYESVDSLVMNKNGNNLVKGTYYIYKTYENYKNITKTVGVPGSWVLIPDSKVVEDWDTKVKKFLVDKKILSDGNWDKNLTKEQIASIIYTAFKKLGGNL